MREKRHQEIFTVRSLSHLASLGLSVNYWKRVAPNEQYEQPRNFGHRNILVVRRTVSTSCWSTTSPTSSCWRARRCATPVIASSPSKDGAEALELVTARAFDVMICDIRLPKLDGLTLFRQTRQESPDTTVILMTAFAAVQDAVAAVKEGAHDYLTKPFDIDEITLRVKRIAEHRALLRELEIARAELAQGGHQRGHRRPLACRCCACSTGSTPSRPATRRCCCRARAAPARSWSRARCTSAAPARGKAFVAVNCAAFPETLLEAELFGHERGAFTGAVKKRDGRFRAAHGGTLLLDEVAEMPLPAQAKLLRVLQEGVIEPLGTNESVRVDVRVISATHRNLQGAGRDGLFREDLYYRLNVLNIDIPPLRERQGDLPLLVQYFLKKLGQAGRGRAAGRRRRPGRRCRSTPFPGNVRELEHAIEHAVVLAGGGDIDIQHLPARHRAREATSCWRASPLPRPLGAALKEFEREYLLRALAQADGKRTLAAEILGISRKNLWEKLRMHGFSDGRLALAA